MTYYLSLQQSGNTASKYLMTNRVCVCVSYIYVWNTLYVRVSFPLRHLITLSILELQRKESRSDGAAQGCVRGTPEPLSMKVSFIVS